MNNLPNHPAPMDIVPSHLPQNPTRTQLLERRWFEFLKFQQRELFNHKKSGFGVPKVDLDEQAFWAWFLDNKLESSDAS